jgi:hypothetical protein
MAPGYRTTCAATATAARAASGGAQPQSLAARYPPANESPAAVVSTTRRTGTAGTRTSLPSRKTCAPAAPNFTTTSAGPLPATRAAQSRGVPDPYSSTSSSHEAKVTSARSVSAAMASAAARGERQPVGR